MARRKKIWIIVGLGTILALGLIVVLSRPTNEKQIPSLLGRPLRFDATLLERTWKDIAAQGDLAGVFSRDRVNRLFSTQAVNCRVNYQGVSYQALLAPAASRIELELKVEKNDQLAFSIFNPQVKALTFLVKKGPVGKEKLLFSSSIHEPIGKVETILLGHVKKETLRLVLETQGAGIGAWINPCQLRHQPRPRTVLILMLDTMRADHVSAYGYKRLTTPALDGLAKDSMLFHRAFSTSSWTLPAHVSLFSGRDVLGHGVVSPESLIPADLPLLAETMEKNGFVTLAQTGGGFVDERYGFCRGFQNYTSRANEIFQREAAGLLYSSFMEDVAHFSGQDLFIFLHTYQMHAPYKAPEHYFRAFNPDLDIRLQGVGSKLKSFHGALPALPAAAAAERQKLIDLYDASILYCDQELIKPLLNFLRASKRFDDALIIVLSDHGEEFADHGGWEHGHTLYQELTHIPLIVKFPRQKRGEIRRQLFSICDVAGLIKEQYGLNDKANNEKGGKRRDGQRILELSLPVSPFHAESWGKVSFVENDYQYIHNFLPPPTGHELGPQPVSPADEWFTLAEMPGAAVEPYSPSPAFHSRYKKMLADYIFRLKALKKNRGKLDPELLAKLKALGYLNN
jgi:arylsulfatase A-like enzyme